MISIIIILFMTVMCYLLTEIHNELKSIRHTIERIEEGGQDEKA